MRVNPIRMNGLPYQYGGSSNARIKFENKNNFDSYSFKGKENEVSFGSLNLTLSPRGLDEVIQVIKDTDEARLDGSILGVYRYSDYMVKSPDFALDNSALKELYALSRIKQFDSSIAPAPLPVVLSEFSERPFLVEEFIPGRLNTQGRYSLTQASSAMRLLLSMDKAGVINQDLSPQNTIYSPETRSMRFIDFDTYSFVTENGRIQHSQSTPVRHYTRTLLPSIDARIENEGSLILPSEREIPNRISQMFANSFRFKGKRTKGLHNLIAATNMSENPYISVPSNLTNYGSRTVFTKIMSGEVDDPCEFLREYLQIKGRHYHTGMRDYLKTLSVEDVVKGRKYSDQISYEEAKVRLQNAIEYEDFLSKLFDKKPDMYFAKLEAAKMQLNALLFYEDLDDHVPNSEQIATAYHNLMNVITEGLYDYREPEYQRYLNAELDRYTEAFSDSRFSSRAARQPIADSLDILKTCFTGVEKDPNSFSVVRRRAKADIREALTALCGDLEDYNLPLSTVKATYGEIAAGIGMQSLGPVKDGFTQAQLDFETARLVDEALAEFTREDLKKLAKQAQDTALAAAGDPKAQGQIAARNASNYLRTQVRRRPRPNPLRRLPSPEAAISERAKEYANQRYAYKGGNLMLKGLILAGIAGVALCKYFSMKRSKENVTLVRTQNMKTKAEKMPLITGITTSSDSPFKHFSI